jgi:hypothetical protein
MKLWNVPTGSPKIRLPSKTKDARLQKGQTRKGGLAMVSGRVVVSLREFLKFAAENVVHAQRLRDFPGYVAVLGSPGTYIRFLQQNQVRWCSVQKLKCLVELLSTINVPADHPDLMSGSAGIGCRKERPRFNFFH